MTAISQHDAEGRRGADQAGDGGGDRGLYRAGDQVPTRQGGKVKLLIRPRYTPKREPLKPRIHKYHGALQPRHSPDPHTTVPSWFPRTGRVVSALVIGGGVGRGGRKGRP